MSGTPLINVLRDGGRVIYWRHTDSDESVPESEPFESYDTCEGQTPLSEAGREEARTIGDAYRAIDIPVGSVLTSLYCRCRETAELAFGRHEDSRALLPPAAARSAERRQEFGDGVRRLLSTSPPRGENTVLVAHSSNFSGASRLDRGDAGVYRPDEGTYTLVGYLRDHEWPELVETSENMP